MTDPIEELNLLLRQAIAEAQAARKEATEAKLAALATQSSGDQAAANAVASVKKAGLSAAGQVSQAAQILSEARPGLDALAGLVAARTRRATAVAALTETLNARALLLIGLMLIGAGAGVFAGTKIGDRCEGEWRSQAQPGPDDLDQRAFEVCITGRRL